jgi:4-cresol dehydrogenase (hydroxylating) flavoprotein subunit
MSESAALPTISDAMTQELAGLLGQDAVHIERARIDEFKDDYWLTGDEKYAASAVVQPTTTEQVQGILEIARRYGIPVWPHSQGRNLGHGGASPKVRGSIQLGFQRMNRILEINEELAYAVVEPGVTWFDLHDAVRAKGYDLSTPCPDLGWGSIVGNTMDGGHTYQRYGADYMLPAGLEVVMPDGAILRTGQGAIPSSAAWHTYKRSLGPNLEPLFVQSNFGIVTRMGIWLTRRPESFAPLLLAIDEESDFEAAVDTVRELRLAGHLEGMPALYSTLRACHMLRDAPVSGQERAFTDPELREIGTRAGVGAWAARAAVWGAPEIVDAKLRRIRDAWETIPSGRVEARRTYSPDEYDQLEYSAEQIMAGEPTLKAIQNTPPNIAHVDVSPVVPLQGTTMRIVIEMIRREFTAAGRDLGVGIMVTGERSAVVIAGVRYDKTDEDSTRSAFDLARRLILELGKLGFGDSRPHLEFMDLAAAEYSFNDNIYRRVATQIKDALDPDGILSPGRHGIWPTNFGQAGTHTSKDPR